MYYGKKILDGKKFSYYNVFMTTKKLMRKVREKMFDKFMETEESKKYLAAMREKALANIRAMIKEN